MTTPNFKKHGKPSCERGYLLVFLCPLLILSLLFLAGTVQVINRTLKKVALQSRLDVCAVEISVERRKLFESLTESNRWLRTTAKGVAIARGAMIFGGPAGILLGSMGEKAMLLVNRATYLKQELNLAISLAKELSRLKCRANSFSQELAFCIATPPLLTAFQREKPFFADVKGGIELKAGKTELAKVQCRSLLQKTVIAVEGDPALSKKEFYETYLQ